jgi:hypothetical protein
VLITPVYMRVGDGTRGLRFTATSYADSEQLVRVWAVARPQGLQKIAEFQQFELRPRIQELADRHVPPLRPWPYWLAILAFHKGGSAWERSPSRHTGFFDVPEVELAFAISDAGGGYAMAVSVDYA